MKAWLKKQLKAKEEARAALQAKGKKSENADEVRSLIEQCDTLTAEIDEFRSQIDAIEQEEQRAAAGTHPPTDPPATPAGEQRSAGPIGQTQVLAAYGLSGGSGTTDADERKKLQEQAEQRGKEIKEGRSVTVGSAGVILPQHQATDIRPGFNEVSTLLDRVTIKPLIGGESFKQPYITGYGTGDYTTETNDYADAEPTFGYAEISKAKITAYAEDTEELQKLPATDYDGEVMKGIRIANRKKLTREILVGTGATNRLAGIFSSAATAIDVATDKPIKEIDEDTLDEIIYSYGGDENVEDLAVLILNKKDLKSFAKLRDAEGQKVHKVTSKGNVGDIDGVPFIINSACKAISDAAVGAGEYCMAYGPLSNYMIAIFSDMDVSRSTDYKFKQGMIAHKGVVFAGGNVVSKNGFLRVKKG